MDMLNTIDFVHVLSCALHASAFYEAPHYLPRRVFLNVRYLPRNAYAGRN